MSSWDVEKTRYLVAYIYGAEQVELVRASLNSLAERQIYASYHFHEYKNILVRHIDSQLGDKHILELTLPLLTEDSLRIDNALNQAAANAIACLQNLHCLIDTMAYAVYYATGLNNSSPVLSPRDISSQSVRKQLSKNPDLSEISDRLADISENPILKHLGALVNHSKHRSIIRPEVNVDLRSSNSPAYKLELPAFVYNKIPYPTINTEIFMEQAYEVLSPSVVACGNALNTALQNIADKRGFEDK